MNTLIQTKLAEYIVQPNALSYTPAMVDCDPSIQDEIRKINDHLCGANNFASKFMLDGSGAEEFFNNVQFNGPRSVPVIIRAIQLALINS